MMTHPERLRTGVGALFQGEIWTNRCRQVLSAANDVDDVRQYLNGVIDALRKGNTSIVEEAVRVALPLCYRLALDDTRGGERFGSAIKNLSVQLLFPKLYQSLEAELETLCKEAVGCSFQSLEGILATFLQAMRRWSSCLDRPVEVYGRVKTPYSIYEKFCKYRTGAKQPAGPDRQRFSSAQKSWVDRFLTSVEGQGGLSDSPHLPYTLDTVKWLLPDLLGSTLQLVGEPEGALNFGAAKQTYLRVLRTLSTTFPVDVYSGPRFSRHWHMKRLSALLMWRSGTALAPVELLIRNDADYLLGYANYWRYKGVALFDSPGAERQSARRDAIRRIKTYPDLRSVQNSLLRDLRSGQLMLF